MQQPDDSCIWHEGQAARINGVVSRQYKYPANLRPDIKHIAMYSDTCQGKKRRHIAYIVHGLSSRQLQSSVNWLRMISFFDSDGDHILIEKVRNKYGVPIYSPYDWMQLACFAGKLKPFCVTEIRLKTFLYSSVLRTENIHKTGTNGEKILWKKI